MSPPPDPAPPELTSDAAREDVAVRMRWAVDPALTYELRASFEVGGVRRERVVVVAGAEVPVTGLRVDALAPMTAYAFALRARNDEGTSGWSTPDVVVRTRPPPLRLLAATVVPTGVVVLWAPPPLPGVTRATVDVLRRGAGGEWEPLLSALPVEGNRFFPRAPLDAAEQLAARIVVSLDGDVDASTHSGPLNIAAGPASPLDLRAADASAPRPLSALHQYRLMALMAMDPEGSGNDPSGNDPSGNDPSGNDPSGNDPSGNDPSGNDPSGNDPTESADPDASTSGENSTTGGTSGEAASGPGVDPTGANDTSGERSPAGTDFGRTDPMRTDAFGDGGAESEARSDAATEPNASEQTAQDSHPIEAPPSEESPVEALPDANNQPATSTEEQAPSADQGKPVAAGPGPGAPATDGGKTIEVTSDGARYGDASMKIASDGSATVSRGADVHVYDAADRANALRDFAEKLRQEGADRYADGADRSAAEIDRQMNAGPRSSTDVELGHDASPSISAPSDPKGPGLEAPAQEKPSAGGPAPGGPARSDDVKGPPAGRPERGPGDGSRSPFDRTPNPRPNSPIGPEAPSTGTPSPPEVAGPLSGIKDLGLGLWKIGAGYATAAEMVFGAAGIEAASVEAGGVIAAVGAGAALAIAGGAVVATLGIVKLASGTGSPDAVAAAGVGVDVTGVVTNPLGLQAMLAGSALGVKDPVAIGKIAADLETMSKLGRSETYESQRDWPEILDVAIDRTKGPGMLTTPAPRPNDPIGSDPRRE